MRILNSGARQRGLVDLSRCVAVWLAIVVVPVVASAGSSRFAGNTNVLRWRHSAFRLQDGRVLVFGGLNNSRVTLKYTELFNPSTLSWTRTGDMLAARDGHAATLLADGRVLVIGGARDTVFYDDDPRIVEIYEPATGRWTRAGRSKKFRVYASTTLLDDGRVLIAGGDVQLKRTYQVYDPSTNKSSAPARMPIDVHSHSATLLQDGRVLIAGGQTGRYYVPTDKERRAFLYNPDTDSWSETGSMLLGHSGHEAVLLGLEREELDPRLAVIEALRVPGLHEGREKRRVGDHLDLDGPADGFVHHGATQRVRHEHLDDERPEDAGEEEEEGGVDEVDPPHFEIALLPMSVR